MKSSGATKEKVLMELQSRIKRDRSKVSDIHTEVIGDYVKTTNFNADQKKNLSLELSNFYRKKGKTQLANIIQNKQIIQHSFVGGDLLMKAAKIAVVLCWLGVKLL